MISTPDKKVIEEDDSINIRGPYGTFIEEEEKEDKEE
jgi:NAD(P)H-flavin reductase